MDKHIAIGLVKSVTGFVTAGDGAGLSKPLSIGDTIFSDDLIYLENDAAIAIHFIDGGIRQFVGEQGIEMSSFADFILDNAQIDIDSLKDTIDIDDKHHVESRLEINDVLEHKMEQDLSKWFGHTEDPSHSHRQNELVHQPPKTDIQLHSLLNLDGHISS